MELIDGNQISRDSLKTQKLKKELKEFDLEKDWVNTISKNERLIRALTDIVSENNVPKKEIKVTEINMSSDLFVKEVEQNMSGFTLTPTDIDYQLIVRSTEDVSEEFRQKASVWDTKEDLNIKASDLIILRDTQQIWKLSLKELIREITDSIKDNGFLIIVTRLRLTEPEIALNFLLKRKKYRL